VIPLARIAGSAGLEGFAHRGLGYIAKMDGKYDEATRHLLEAIRLIPPERSENRHARFLLCEVKNRTGRHDEARADFLALLDEARLRKDRWLEAAVFNDLGLLEYAEGDMALADRYWEFAAGVFDSTNNAPSAVDSRINRAHALIHLGKSDDARAMIERLIADGNRLPDKVPRNAAMLELGDLYRELGRNQQAEEMLRAGRAAQVDDVESQLTASMSLAELLGDTGRPREAEALLDSLLADPRVAKLNPDDLSGTRLKRSKLRRALARPREALADARVAERLARTGRSRGSIYWLDAAIELGRCQRAVGRPDSAVAILRSAAQTWERWRAEISDLQWREREGSKLSDLFAEYGLALLDTRRAVPEAARAREAFDALQAFQARTLEDRMHGSGLAGRGMSVRVTADSLRRGVLRDGELLVDLVATPDTTIAFLVTRARVEARLLPGTRRLNQLHGAWQEATLAGADNATVQSGLARLSRELLGPIAPAFRGAQRIIVTGGGPIALWPLGALTVPGESGPLCEHRELYTAPSTTLLAALRARGQAPRGGGMLAVGRTTDASGRDLPGAQSELQSLGSKYMGVEVRVNKGERPMSELTSDLPRWDVLHFAAHAESEARTPWRSGFLLGAGTGDGAYLRASGVATMRLRADLAVLSGCQSAGAATLAGEGALGLANAFLCSGTRSVVATLWPIDDRVAQQFMAEFYASLARGRTVASAVSEAQRALRSHAETSSPRDWAAFAASGEGGTRVRLTPRSAPSGGSSGPARP
jgi:CHAT domain-containing protein/tetratricopeptide (TPR) repeat protein